LKILHTNSSVKKEYKREGKQVVEEEPPKNLGREKEKERPREGTSSQNHTRDILCFQCLDRDHVESQCPTKRSKILRGLNVYIAKMKKALVKVRMNLRTKLRMSTLGMGIFL